MLKIISAFLFSLMISCQLPADDFINNFSFGLGAKKLKSSDWPDFDTQFMFGFYYDFQHKKMPFSVVLDVVASIKEKKYDEEVTFSASTYEFNTGVRKYFDTKNGKVLPYLGGGIGIVIGEYFATDGFDDDRIKDSGFNLWADVGVKFKFHERLTFGFDLKYSKSEIEFFNTKVDAGGLGFAFLVGVQY